MEKNAVSEMDGWMDGLMDGWMDDMRFCVFEQYLNNQDDEEETAHQFV